MNTFKRMLFCSCCWLLDDDQEVGWARCLWVFIIIITIIIIRVVWGVFFLSDWPGRGFDCAWAGLWVLVSASFCFL